MSAQFFEVTGISVRMLTRHVQFVDNFRRVKAAAHMALGLGPHL